MTEQEKKAAEIDATLKADKAKKDAEAAAVVPEKVLSALDACMSKLDALEGKIAALGESPEKKDAAKKDDEGSDDKPNIVADAAHRATLADAQGRADAVAQAFGSSAPRPMDGESVRAYRNRMMFPYLQYSPSFKDVEPKDIRAIPDGAFDAFEARIYADAVAASHNPIVPEGRLMERTKIDPVTGFRSTEFFGTSFIKSMKRPARRVTRFMTKESV